MSWLAPIGSVAVASAAALALWSWLGRPIDLPAVPGGRLDCVSYTPTHGDVSPLDGSEYEIPAGTIERDLEVLSRRTGCLRTYASSGINSEVLPAARALGLEVKLGIWIQRGAAENEVEIEAALALAEEYPDTIRTLIVGNEVLLRREMRGERLAAIIRSVDGRTDVPVTYADMIDFWVENPEVAAAVDAITIHVLPYWDDPTAPSIDAVRAWVDRALDEARAAFPGRTIEIGEIGWPSAGRTRGHARPSRVNQARFVREIAVLTARRGFHANLMEAIDQPWKRELEGTVGGSWGILDRERRPKFPLSGPVREWPDSGLATLFAALAAAAAVLVARVAGMAPVTAAGWLGVALAGAATASVLWITAARVEAFALDLGDRLFGGYWMAAAILGGGLLAAESAGLPAAWRGPPADLASVLRSLRAGRTSPAILLGLLRYTVLVPTAVVALCLAVDGRYRDFWNVAILLPAFALGVRAWRERRAWRHRAPEDAWLGVAVAVSGLLAIDARGNVDALLWGLGCVILAAPCAPAMAAEAARLRRVLGGRSPAPGGG